MTTTDTLWTDRLASIMPDNFLTNRTTEFTAKANLLENMINRIGRTYIAGQPNAYNPFDSWNASVMEYGDTVQKYTLPYITGTTPDYEPDDPNPFKTAKPTTESQYWTINDAVQYKQTIWQDQIQKAFTSAETFGTFTGEIMSQMYKSVGIDNFLKWKKYIGTVDFIPEASQVSVEYTDETDYGITLWKTLKDWVTNKLKYPSSDYNAMGFLTSSPSVDVVITTEARNMMDNALSGVYNVDRIIPPGLNFIQIDSFPEQTSGTLDAVIMTSGMAQYIPRVPIGSALYNPENYYTNYWYKQEGMFLIDQAQNAVSITRTESA